MVDFKDGTILYYVRNGRYVKTVATVDKSDDNWTYINLSFDEEFEGITSLRTYTGLIGEMLFFNIEDIEKPIEVIASDSNYSSLNPELKKFISKNKEKITENVKPDDIKKYLTERGVEHFVHFTPIDNIESILKYGICSRKRQEELEIKSQITDPERFDNHMEYSSLSITSPNYKYMTLLRTDKNLRLAVIVIDINMLDSIRDPKSLLFLRSNAARKENSKADIEKHNGMTALKKLFSDKATYKNRNGENKSTTREELKLHDNEPTDPQAEVMVSETIDSKYIKEIHFDYLSNEEIKKFEQIIPDNISRYVDNEDYYFRPRHDYTFWQKS